jgi:hypothetical protein
MKKTLKELLTKLKQETDGTLTGGFGSIKGGYSVGSVETTNTILDNCSNSQVCGGINSSCTNSGFCGDASNTYSCSNTFACAF